MKRIDKKLLKKFLELCLSYRAACIFYSPLTKQMLNNERQIVWMNNYKTAYC